MFLGCQAQTKNTSTMKEPNKYNIQKSDKEWKEILSDEQFRVLREAGTERPHTGEYNLHFEDGVYSCAACGEELFTSDAKFESHCGWPSFDKAEKGKVIEKLDRSHGMTRTEILCAKCGSHLGPVFNDGPTATGLRYCVNSVSLDFEKDSAQ